MKYVFFGGRESEFAQIILNGLKNAGQPPMAEIRDAKSLITLEYLLSLNADFFLVAAFAKILEKEIIGIPKYKTIGIHPSLLPRLRGPSPIQSTILNDEQETGTTLFIIDEKIDHGPTLATNKLQITTKDDNQSLTEKLAELSVKLALDTIPKLLAGKIQPQIQDESQATYTKKFDAEDAQVNLKNDAPKKIWLKIRALNPEPGVFTILKLKNGKELRLKLLKADFNSEKLQLLTVQPEGKKPMSYKAFLNGYQNLLS